MKHEVGTAFLGGKDHRGKKAAEDHGKAAELFDRACSGGYGPGCTSLGEAFAAGDGGKKDREEAVRLYRQACTVLRPKKAEACRLLAQAFKGGDGIGFDANAAGQYFRQACELESDDGCREWRLDSCNRLGDPAACEWLEKRGLEKR